jgi:hypothetical protein
MAWGTAVQEAPAIDKNALIQEWNETKRQLDRTKEKERELRDKVILACFPNHKEKGTENLPLGNKWKLKAVFKTTFGFINSNKNNEVEDMLQKLEKTGVEGQVIAERLIRFKPELDVKEYEKLSANHKKIVDSILVTRPATPTLELVEPK